MWIERMPKGFRAMAGSVSEWEVLHVPTNVHQIEAYRRGLLRFAVSSQLGCTCLLMGAAKGLLCSFSNIMLLQGAPGALVLWVHDKMPATSLACLLGSSYQGLGKQLTMACDSPAHAKSVWKSVAG